MGLAERVPVSGRAVARPGALGSSQAEGRLPSRRHADPRADALVVRLEDGVPLEGALRAFKRKVRAAGLLQDLRRREAFMTRGARRRAKQGKARARARKANSSASSSRIL